MSIFDYQLFLFDFDGLLVNSEPCHLQAYKLACSYFGVDVNWNVKDYLEYSKGGRSNFQKILVEQYPKLKKIVEEWNEFYQKKSSYLEQLFDDGNVSLMPGAMKLLTILENAKIDRCVVTNSSKAQVEFIKSKNEILRTITVWFTREDYKYPKPDPECYRNAIRALAADEDNVIGFEDSWVGIQALSRSRAKAVLVNKTISYKLPNVHHCKTLEEWIDNNVNSSEIESLFYKNHV